MSLETVEKVFVFNSFGAANLRKIFGSKADSIVGFRVPPMVNSPVFTSVKGSILPTLPTISDGTFKARTNAMKCQNIKVLFHKDAAAFIEFAGPLEDIGGEHVIAAVQSRVPLEFLDMMVLQPKRIKILAGLMFQLVEGDGLHLSLFRKPSVVPITSTYQLKRCFENFTEVLKAIVGGDDEGYLFTVFFQILGHAQ
jgi:hypothetical protein